MSQPSSSSPEPPSTESVDADRDSVIRRIGDWQIEPDELVLRRDGIEPRRLEPKVMDLLLCLAEQAPRVVSRDEIFENVWQGRAVVDGALSRAVSLLRRALDDDSKAPRYIETVPRRGYRLVATVDRAVPVQTPTPAGGPSPSARLAWVFVLVGLIGLLVWGLGFLGSGSEPESDAGAKAPDGPIRLAVLPLDQLGGSGDERYLADGLTEELTHQLATLSALGVVSRTSATAAKAQGQTAPEIARALRLDYLLEGSVTVAAGRLRVTLQLIATEQDEHVWSRAYDRPLVNMLDLQRDIARDVTAQVEAELTPPEQARLDQRGAVDGEAYRLYLQGLQHLDRRTRKDLKAAREYLERCLELDPDLAPAWAAQGRLHLLSELYLKVPQAQAYSRAQASIDRALALDAGLATAHVSLGQLRLMRDWDWSGAEASYRTALRLEPSFALAHQWLSELLSLAGRHDEALVAVGRAADLDPLSPLVHAAWGQRLNAAGRHREALERFAAADGLGARFAWHWREVAYAHERLGNETAALDAHVERMRRRAVKGEAMAALQEAIRTGGLPGYWRWQRGRLSKMKRVEPMLMAEAAAGSGDLDGARPWLEAAVAKRGSWFLHLVKSPAFDGLRDDPRFVRLVAQARP